MRSRARSRAASASMRAFFSRIRTATRSTVGCRSSTRECRDERLVLEPRAARARRARGRRGDRRGVDLVAIRLDAALERRRRASRRDRREDALSGRSAARRGNRAARRVDPRALDAVLARARQSDGPGSRPRQRGNAHAPRGQRRRLGHAAERPVQRGAVVARRARDRARRLGRRRLDHGRATTGARQRSDSAPAVLTMANRYAWIALGLGAYIAFALSTFPAAAAYRWFAPAELRLVGIEGTVWSGRAALASVENFPMQDLRWSIDALPLLIGRVNGRVRASLGEGFVESIVKLSPSGDVELTDLRMSTSLASLASALPVGDIRGQLAV